MNQRMWMRTTRSGLAAAIAMVWAGQASAQQFEATGTTFGPPTRQLDIELSGTATYDSNISRSSDAGASARGIDQEDVRLTPTARADIVLPTPAAVLTLTGSVGYDFYLRNKRLNRERLDLLAGAGTKLAICDVGGQLGYSRGQNDLADLSIVAGNPTLSTVNVQDTMRAGGTIACGTAIRPTAFVQYRTTENSAAQRRISDVDMLGYGGGLSYSNERFGVLTAFVGRYEYDFPERAGIATALQAFKVTTWGLRLDRRLGARLQVHGQVTYVDVSGAGAASDRFDGLNWDASAALRVGERAQVTVSVLRQIDATAAFNLRTAQISLYSAQFDYAFSPLLRGGLGASIRDRDFESDPALTPIVLLGDDRLVEIGGRLAYTLGQRITVNLNASYQSRTADIALYDYRLFRGSIGVSLRL